MKRTLCASVVLAVAAGFGASQASAQGAAQPMPAQRAPAAAAPAQTMDLESAKKIVAGAEAAAAAANQHVAICVMDTNGDVVLAERMNGVGRVPQSTAQGKARTVLMFGIPTGQIADSMQNKKPVTANITALPIGGGGELIVMRGGLPVMKDGKLIGSVAVGGSASESDEQFAQAGIDTLKGK